MVSYFIVILFYFTFLVLSNTIFFLSPLLLFFPPDYPLTNYLLLNPLPLKPFPCTPARFFLLFFFLSASSRSIYLTRRWIIGDFNKSKGEHYRNGIKILMHLPWKSIDIIAMAKLTIHHVDRQ